jgi:small subunit ribosomal protein S15
MARLYSRRRGKSKSTKPFRAEPPKWAKGTTKDIEKLVADLAKAGKGPAEIGMFLRDQHGIPDVKLMTKKSITQILKDNELLPEFPTDLTDLIRVAVRIKRHYDLNRQDMDAKRGLQLTEAKIRRLVKYYKRMARIPADWKYSIETARLLVE